MTAYEVFKSKSKQFLDKKLLKRYFLDLYEADTLFNLEEISVNEKQIKSIGNDLKKINKGVPIAYLLKKKFFYNSYFFVNKHTLIPRPETEQMVGIMVDKIKKSNLRTINVLDMATGSGCIGITIKKEIPYVDILCTDISKKALKIAKINSQGMSEISFLKSNIFSKVPNIKFDFIISNPPYVSKEFWKENKILRNEPKKALVWNQKKTFYRLFLENVLKFTHHKFCALIEISEFDVPQIEKLLTEFSLRNISRILKDDFKNNRILIIERR